MPVTPPTTTTSTPPCWTGKATTSPSTCAVLTSLIRATANHPHLRPRRDNHGLRYRWHGDVTFTKTSAMDLRLEFKFGDITWDF